MQDEKDKWGEGYDYLFKDIWSNLDQIRLDNESYKHDEKNIEHCFGIMYSALRSSSVEAVKSSDWESVDKLEVLQKISDTLKLFKEAKTINDKVIAINTAEQLLRSIY